MRAGVSRSSESFWRSLYRLNATIAAYPKPYVVVQDGIVLGGGVGISAHGDVRIVTETSRVGMPEVRIGFVPDAGGSWLLARAPGELGTHVAVTGNSVGPEDAMVLGLADHFIERARIPAFLRDLEDDDAASVVDRYQSGPPAGRLTADAAWIDEAYAGDDLQLILERLRGSHEAPATDALRTISANSPTAATLTLTSLRRARQESSLAEALDREYRVSLRCLLESDFAEGIRARVIEKDRSPQWSPATLAFVDPAHIDSFFAPLGDRELGMETYQTSSYADAADSQNSPAAGK